MPSPSIQLQSDQYLAPFQHAANEAQANAYIQTPQLALHSFLQMRQLRMQEQQNAAHVALEHAQIQDYYQRINAFNAEIQTRGALAQAQLLEVQARKAHVEMETSLAPFKNTGMQMGQIYETSPGKYQKAIPNNQGKPTWMEASKDEITHHKEMEQARLGDIQAKARQERARADYLDTLGSARGEELAARAEKERAQAAGTIPSGGGSRGASAPPRGSINPVVLQFVSSGKGYSAESEKLVSELSKDYGSSAVNLALSDAVHEAMRRPQNSKMSEDEIVRRILNAIGSDPDAEKSFRSQLVHYANPKKQ